MDRWVPINGTFGGAFIYSMGGDRVAIGLLAVLDAHNPDQDVHYLLQKLKLHPKIREILKGGKVVKYGAKSRYRRWMGLHAKTICTLVQWSLVTLHPS